MFEVKKEKEADFRQCVWSKKTYELFSYKETKRPPISERNKNKNKNKIREKNQIYISKLHVSTVKKIILNKKCRERRKICKHVLPQFRIIGEDDKESAKVMKLFLDDSRLSFWWECPFSFATSASLCKLRWLLLFFFFFLLLNINVNRIVNVICFVSASFLGFS